MLNLRAGTGAITLALVAVLAGCGGDGEPDAATGGPDGAPAAPVVDPAEAAAIEGVVHFEGQAPPPESIEMSDEPVCLEQHGEPPTRRRVVASDGRLGNVFVYVKEGLGDRQFPTPREPKVLDQVGCIYTPHVMGVQTGQQITIRNSDGILHNINANPSANRGFNISQPTRMESTRQFGQEEVMIPFRCDVHGWMEAYVGVLSHPYYAVSGEDGSFRIGNLPPGDYTLEAWHERYGTQTMNVSVAAQETGEAEFTYSEAMAGAVVPLGDPVDPHDHGPGGVGR